MTEEVSREDAGPAVGLVQGRTIVLAALAVVILYSIPLLLYAYPEAPALYRVLSLGGPVLAAMLAALLLGRAGLAVASVANVVILIYFGREMIGGAADLVPELALAVIGFILATQIAATVIALLAEHVRGSVRQLELANSSLERLALVDEMTGLYNFRYFGQRVVEELAAADRNENPVVLILLDIDHFKHYNDTYGHLQEIGPW